MDIEIPEPADVPPQLTVYHFHKALNPKLPSVTVKVVEVPRHTGFWPADTTVGATDD